MFFAFYAQIFCILCAKQQSDIFLGSSRKAVWAEDIPLVFVEFIEEKIRFSLPRPVLKHHAEALSIDHLLDPVISGWELSDSSHSVLLKMGKK